MSKGMRVPPDHEFDATGKCVWCGYIPPNHGEFLTAKISKLRAELEKLQAELDSWHSSAGTPKGTK